MANKCKKRPKTGNRILDEFLSIIREIGPRFVAEESGIHENSIWNWTVGKSAPTLINAQRALNAIGYELVIFEKDEPFEEVDR